VGGVSWDNRQVALSNYVSATESTVWLLDLASGDRRQLLPAPGATAPAQKATHLAAGFSRDNKSLFVVSDRAGEFNEMLKVDLASGAASRVTGHIPWDVDGGSLSEDGQVAALRLNEDGLGKLRLFDANSLKELPAPTLPAGNLGATQFHKQKRELAFSVNGSAGPGQIYSLDTTTGTVQQWTRAHAPAGVDPSRFSPQQIVRWPSFDGRTISGLMTLPPARFAGKRPVLINIHGGPEGQAQFGFLSRNNYFVEEMGIAVIQPNVRGSSGYGKTFITLDNGFKREDSVKDIGALLDWIATQPNLDASRVVVTGGSYGGYMSLAVSTHYADRIAGAIDVVGISHFVTFLNNTESYRRDLRRVEYGDERDPAMREHLERISPLTNASKIKKPLFVVQGRNDPRVPWTEAEQIVQKARANGTPVWYLRAENEGHGFQRKENADYQFYATVLFLRQVLGLR
jgi:dipeptidyl aminopeptidase/acylaminoacyl peptidase